MRFKLLSPLAIFHLSYLLDNQRSNHNSSPVLLEYQSENREHLFHSANKHPYAILSIEKYLLS